MPELQNTIYINNNNTWTSVKEIYVPTNDPFNIGNFIWAKVWEGFPPPPSRTKFTFGYDEFTSSGACFDTPTIDVWSASSVLGIGDTLFTSESGNIPVADGFWSDGGDWYRTESGQIAEVGSCAI